MEYYDDLEQNQVNEPTTDKFSQAFSKYNMNVDSAWVNSLRRRQGDPEKDIQLHRPDHTQAYR